MIATHTIVLMLVVVLAMLARQTSALSVFIRTPWLSELPEDNWRAWFELIKRGRAEGPTSPYYVEELAFQNTACCNSPDKYRGCLGPKCSELNLPPNALLVDDLDQLTEYFPLFDRVWIGTTIMDYTGSFSNRTAVSDYARLQAKIGSEFLERYGELENVSYGWYLTDEGGLPSIGLNEDEGRDFAFYLNESMKLLKEVREMPFLWSPANEPHVADADKAKEQAGLENVFCSLSNPIALHFQDCLGQTTLFEFPFYYNYTGQQTCEDDTVPTFELLKRVQKRCPQLREVKVNVEFFAERLNNGMHGEDNGANIVNANPFEIAQRLECYAKHHLPIGACWAINHWHDVFTFANQTVYHPY